jgi:hypothetical protein
MSLLLSELIKDYYLLKYINKNNRISMRMLTHELQVSLGCVHSRIESLIARNNLTFTDLINGSREKKIKYEITESGNLYRKEISSKLKTILLAELESIQQAELERTNHEFKMYLDMETEILSRAEGIP